MTFNTLHTLHTQLTAAAKQKGKVVVINLKHDETKAAFFELMESGRMYTNVMQLKFLPCGKYLGLLAGDKLCKMFPAVEWLYLPSVEVTNAPNAGKVLDGFRNLKELELDRVIPGGIDGFDLDLEDEDSEEDEEDDPRCLKRTKH